MELQCLRGFYVCRCCWWGAILGSQPLYLSLQCTDDTLEVTVTNPGPPLPERMRSQLFDSMVSVRAAGSDKHLGLGLYVARLIAEGHGGRIKAENSEDGVRFSVVLPVADAKLAQIGRK